jgi:hypothetical protein
MNRDHDLPAEPKPMGQGLAKEEALMHYVICKRGRVRLRTVQAELRIGTDRLMVPVEAEVCDECGRLITQPRRCSISNKCVKTFSAKSSLRPRLGRCTRFPDSQASQLA